VKRKALSVTIAESRWQALRAIAEDRGMAVSELVDAMLALALAHPPFQPNAPQALERVVPRASAHAAEAGGLTDEDLAHPGGG
jgi:hypothetical protein